MKIKKAFTALVEGIVTEDGNVTFVLRSANGQPIETLETPAALATVFQELSADDAPAESPEVK